MATPAWGFLTVAAVLIAAGVVVLARQTATQLGTPDSPIAQLPRRTLYLNVAVSHGLVLGLIGLLVWWTAIPVGTLGLRSIPDPVPIALVAGGLIGFNELAERVARRLDLPENPLRALLTPETGSQWITLAGLVLPLIAVTEEVLFRGVLIGAIHTGTSISAPVLLVGSSVLFGAAHTAQGRMGVGIASVLGLLLGGVFLWSESLWLVIGAHYLVDLVEFARHR